MRRGANQSIDTKYAAVLLCEALDVISRGRVVHAKELIEKALTLLPYVESEKQREAELKVKKSSRGFHA